MMVEKQMVTKGTISFIVNENKEITNQSICMDKDRELAVGDVFNFNEDYHNFTPTPFKIVGFANIFPLIIEVEKEEREEIK